MAINSGRSVRIVLTGHGKGEVFVDGKKLDGVVRVGVSAGVDRINSVTIDFSPQEIEVEGIFDITTIGEKFREYAKHS